jgi:hypothetical protein
MKQARRPRLRRKGGRRNENFIQEEDESGINRGE